MKNMALVFLMGLLCCFCKSFASELNKGGKEYIYITYSEELQRRVQELLADEVPELRFTRRYKWKLDEFTMRYAVELGISNYFLREIKKLPLRRTRPFVHYAPPPWYVVDFGPYLIPIIGEDLYYKIKKREVKITATDIKLYMEGMIKLYDVMYDMSLKLPQAPPCRAEPANEQ